MADRENGGSRVDLEVFFDAHAPRYMENVFTRATDVEIEFLLEELRISEGSSILDAGCGTGRHAVKLASKGFKVTGVDQSEGMLRMARKAADEARVDLNLIKTDLTTFRSESTFDAAICLCEGGFGLLDSRDEYNSHDLEILKNIHRALNPGGRFVLTALSSLRMARMYGADEIASGQFDPITMTEKSIMEIDGDPQGRSVTFFERGFVPTELALMLQLSGFEVENIWGGTAGNWGRRPVDPDEMEVMAVAVRNDDLLG